MVGNSSPPTGLDISGSSHGCSTDSHKAQHPIGRLGMVPSIISYVWHTDHGPCANLHVYKQAWIYETVPRLSTCDILLHCSAPLYHCSTLYSSAFAQHCIVTPLALTPHCTHLHPHRLHPPRVSPSDPVSLLQVRPLPTISSESQHLTFFLAGVPLPAFPCHFHQMLDVFGYGIPFWVWADHRISPPRAFGSPLVCWLRSLQLTLPWQLAGVWQVRVQS